MPDRKLQTVRFSTLTSFALYTTMPLRPTGLAADDVAVLLVRGAVEHAGAPGLVPSTMTPDAAHPAQVQVRRRDEHAAEGALE